MRKDTVLRSVTITVGQKLLIFPQGKTNDAL